MKLLHVLAMDTTAGLENRVARFITSTDKSFNHSILVINDRIHKKFRRGLNSRCEIFHWKYTGLIKKPKCVRPFFLNRFFAENKYDFIIAYNQLSKPSLIESICNRSSPTIYADSGGVWYNERNGQARIARYDFYTAISRASKIFLQKKFRIADEQIRVIRGGLSESFYERASKPSRERPSDCYGEFHDNKSFLLLFLGRLIAHKGINLLIRSLTHLPEEVRLLVVGTGIERTSQEELATRENVDHRVRFLGHKTDPVPYLKEADVLVSPSVREPSGNVNLEAGAASLPVISARVDGIPDYVRHEESGLLLNPSLPIDQYCGDYSNEDFPNKVVDPKQEELVEPRLLDPKDIARAVLRLKNNPRFRKKLGNSLQQRIKDRFMTRHYTKKLMSLFQELQDKSEGFIPVA